MSTRRKERELAVQLAYALDLTGDGFEDAKFRFLSGEPRRRKTWGDFSEALVSCATEKQCQIDERIRGVLQHWRLERLASIDRAVLRLAVCELAYMPDIPMRVTINEYIEIAGRFGTDESPAFVNGILDAVAKQFPEKQDEKPEAAEPAE